MALLLLAAAHVQAAGQAEVVTRQEYDGLNQRVEELEKAKPEAGFDLEWLKENEWLKHLTLSCLVEVEGSYADTDPAEGSDTSQSDIVLATVEIGLGLDITDWISGEVVLLWEEDDTEPMDVDVGVVHLGNAEEFPLYFEAGKMYPPFGRFESSFITDPVVLELGETRESAARLGAVFGPVDFSISAFNGDVDEAGEDDDHVENLVFGVAFEHKMEPVQIAAGAAYTTNLADSDGLTDEVAADDATIRDYVAGLNVWAGLSCGRVGLLAEYVGAVDEFEADELAFAGAEKARPWSVNFEAAFEVTDKFSIAGKCEIGDDLFDFQPDERYGVCGSYVLYEGNPASATLSLEYLHDDYETDDQADTVTVQLAIGF